uniref:Uncharacterized protein n=1 Tax=viral metagenome TaxID=1070528 RepID=A0A6C0C3Q7_9ZZZZ
MEFTEESNELTEFLLPIFNNFSIKKSPLKQKKINNILKMLYNDIKLADRWVTTEQTLNKIQRYLKNNETKENLLPTWVLNESKYIPEFVRSHIIDNLTGYMVYTSRVGDREIEIYFGLLCAEDFNSVGTFDKYVKKMLIWLKIAFKYAPPTCSKKLKIYGFLTPFQKNIPDNKFTTISQDHCNSAMTTSCVPHGEIIVYRKQEFFKVFIHETFHTLGLDFSNMPLTNFNKKVSRIFPINSEFNLFEGYAELWASTINCLLSAYFLTGNKEEDFYLYNEFCNRFEQVFSLFQMTKILDFMGLDYTHLYNNDSISIRQYLFKEKTNVFAYYIIKTILLYNNTEFLLWCKKHNDNLITFKKTTDNLDSFMKFIVSKYKNPQFLNDIKKMHGFLKKQQLMQNQLTKTMRMSICELN